MNYIKLTYILGLLGLFLSFTTLAGLFIFKETLSGAHIFLASVELIVMTLLTIVVTIMRASKYSEGKVTPKSTLGDLKFYLRNKLTLPAGMFYLGVPFICALSVAFNVLGENIHPVHIILALMTVYLCAVAMLRAMIMYINISRYKETY